MHTMQITLQRPTCVEVDAYIEEYDREQKIVQQALTRLFEQYRDNGDLANVLLKVVTLNGLYSTNIYATYQVAEHIYQLNSGNYLDALLTAGQPDAVSKIARVNVGGKERNLYSFATKYCAWHNPTDYPIYDSYVEWLLWQYRKHLKFATYARNDTGDYVQFRQIVILFQETYGLTSYSFKDLDKFLWRFGRQYYSQLQSSPTD